MGWGNCGTDSRGRKIGYYHRGFCDHPGCVERIERSLSYACGGMHGNDDPNGSCEKYFCDTHLTTVECTEEGGGNGRYFGVCENCKKEGIKFNIFKEE